MPAAIGDDSTRSAGPLISAEMCCTSLARLGVTVEPGSSPRWGRPRRHAIGIPVSPGTSGTRTHEGVTAIVGISSRAVQALLVEELAAGLDGCGSPIRKDQKSSGGEVARSAGL
jgi:hypothetical protein